MSITILAIADLHYYKYDELIVIKNHEFDVCVLLGDIPEDAIQIIKKLSDKPVIAVPGNHDEWDTPQKGGAVNIHGTTFQVNGYSFAGVGGSARYKNEDYAMLTQKESVSVCNSLDKSDILISHDTMYHLFDKDKAHCGLIGIDLYNIKNRPKLNICGHYHQSVIKKRWRTVTACIFRCAIIQYPDIKVFKVF